jgi:hypothetical protein
MGLWTPPRTWLQGEQPAAETWNEQIRDNLLALASEDWVFPTLLNGWVAYDTNFATARARRVAGVTEVHGTIKNGSAAPGSVLFELPAGWGPQYNWPFTAEDGAPSDCYLYGGANDTVFIGEAVSAVSHLLFQASWPSANED